MKTFRMRASRRLLSLEVIAFSGLAALAAACGRASTEPAPPPPSLAGTWLVLDSLPTRSSHGTLRNVELQLPIGSLTGTLTAIDKDGVKVEGYTDHFTYDYPAVGFSMIHIEGSTRLAWYFGIGLEGVLTDDDHMRGRVFYPGGVYGDSITVARKATP